MLLSAATTVQKLGWTASDTALVCLHPAYIAGKMMLIRALETGMSLVVTEPQIDPLATLLPKQRQHLTVTALVPMQLEHLYKHYGSALFALTSFRSILLGGSAVSAGLQSILPEIMIPVWHTYGMTETCSHIGLRRVNGTSPETHFTAVPGVSLSLDSRGCLVIEGDVCVEGRVVTNDLVELLDPHTFIWIGRHDHTVNSGGIKLNLDELEETYGRLLRAAGVMSRSVLTAIPDATLGEALTLVIEGEPTNAAVKLRMEQAFSSLPSYQRPKYVVRIADFPLTPTGKVDRKAITQTAVEAFS